MSSDITTHSTEARVSLPFIENLDGLGVVCALGQFERYAAIDWRWKMALSDEFLRALGRISANFQALEIHIAFLTWSMIGPDQNIGQIVTSQVSFSRLCDLLSSLFRYRVKDSALVEELEDILRRASEAEQRRNTVIHSVWLTDDTGGTPSRLKITSKRKKGLDVHTEDMDADELNKIADLIREVAEDMAKFIGEVVQKMNVSPASPE